MLLGNYDPGTHTGIAKAARELNWHLNVSMLSAFQVPSHWEGDGIICSLDHNLGLEKFILRSELPCVDLSTWRSDLDLPRVSGDNAKIGELAAEHFCDYGHSSFGFFCHIENQVAENRFEKYREVLKIKGHTEPSKCVGKDTQDSAKVAEWLSSLKRPCGIFVYNDVDASWLLNVCLESGYQIPDEFAILGVDNNALICEHQAVPLSSINHNHERIGYEGAYLLDGIMKGKPVPDGVYYIQPNGIAIRESSDALAVEDSLVKQALQFLKKNLRKAIGVQEVAESIGVSRRTLEVRFQAAMKTSVHKKLLSLRLDHAKKLIRKTDHSIEDVAALSGFCHAPHLCRAFKQCYQMTPLEMRKQKDFEQ